jgi:hypothetical protein
VCCGRASPAEPAGSTPSSPGRNGQINKAITEASRCQLRGVQLQLTAEASSSNDDGGWRGTGLPGGKGRIGKAY